MDTQYTVSGGNYFSLKGNVRWQHCQIFTRITDSVCYSACVQCWCFDFISVNLFLSKWVNKIYCSNFFQKEVRESSDRGWCYFSIQIVNIIKRSPKNSRTFSACCCKIGSDHTSLLLHTGVGWLTLRNVLARLLKI